MSERDAAAVLGAALEAHPDEPLVVLARADVEAAYTELMELRYAGMDDADANEALRKARVEALEEAARVVEHDSPYAWMASVVAAIRALKTSDNVSDDMSDKVSG